MRLMGVGYYYDTAGNLQSTAVERPYPPPYRPLKNPLGGDVGVPTRDGTGTFAPIDLTFSADLTGSASSPNGGLLTDYTDTSTGQNVPLFAATGRTTTPALQTYLNNNPGSYLPLFAAPGADGEEDDRGNPNFVLRDHR